jgi:hypothetical protein
MRRNQPAFIAAPALKAHRERGRAASLYQHRCIILGGASRAPFFVPLG